ncbi:MAG: M20/M25/M40 family metallo-hydrolase [bacterium]
MNARGTVCRLVRLFAAICAVALIVAWIAPVALPAAANSRARIEAAAIRAIPAGETPPPNARLLRALPCAALYETLPFDAAALGDDPRGAEPSLFVLQSMRGRRDDLARDPNAWGAARGVRVLWTDGTYLLVDAPEPAVLDAITAEGYRLEALAASAPAQAGRALLAPPPNPAPRATDFAPAVDEIAACVDADSVYEKLGALSGAESTFVGGGPYLFRTRHTQYNGGRKAEQWCYDAFAGLGLATEFESVPVGSTQARNVIATLPGRVTPERIFIIGGHLDSTSPQPATRAPGAEDNGSGAVGVIEAARVLRKREFASTIKFICFTGEEQGLYGSTRNASNAVARGDSIFGVVIMDMIGWRGTTYTVTIEGQVAWDSLMTVMDDACARYTPLATEKTYFSFGSDHVPYQARGYPAFLAIQDEYAAYPCYHQTCDTLANISKEQAADIIRAGVATIAHLAQPVEAVGIDSPVSAASAGALFLWPAVPNPFGPSTMIRFRTSESAAVRIDIYDVEGRRVRTLHDGAWTAPGVYAEPWDGLDAAGRPAASGVYFLELSTAGASRVRSVVLMR